VLDSFAGLVARFPEEIGEALGDLALACRGFGTLSDEDTRSLARLEQLRAGASSHRNELS
jgi:hypothetical protein